MGFRITNDAALKALERLMKVPEKLPTMANTVEAESLGMAITAAQANIYNTAEGAYRRTGDYLRSLHADARATRFTVNVRVWSDSEYAAAIEFGRDHTSQAMLQAAALAGPVNDPLTLGRSGKAWWIAGPVLTSAQVFAARKLREMLGEAVREAL